MSVYYINGTSTSGSTFGTNGFFYPLYLTASEANSASANTLGTSHPHTFEEAPNITFYMPTTGVTPIGHALTTPPTGNYSSEVYVSYTSPIAEVDVEEIGFGVLAGDTFNSWRKKTNDVARETITNTATIGSVDTRLTRLLSVTGGENNIMTLTSSDNITGEKEFEGIVKFSAADDSANAIQVGANGKIYVESSSFKFTQSIDLHSAGAEIKASDFDVPTGRTKLANVQYTWPSQSPVPGQILKSGSGNTLNWATETAAEAQVEAFLIEDPNPIGSIYQWTTTNPPSKWLVCDGSVVNRVTVGAATGYPDLFGVIGKTYNLSTDTGADFTGTTPVKFRLPNLKGRVPIGVGTSTDAIGTQAQFTLGQTSAVVNGVTINGGEYQHDITIEEMPIHGHAIPSRYDDGNNTGTSATPRSTFDNSSLTQGGISLGNSDNGPLQFRGNFVTGLAGGNSYTAASRGIRNTTIGSALSTLYDGLASPAAPFIGAGLPEEYTGQNKKTQGTTTDSGDGTVNESSINIIQPFIALNYIIKYEGSTIVTQNVTPSNGILINDAAAQTNLLAANSVNTIKMDVNTTDDFKFTGNTLELKTRPLSIDYRLIKGTVRTRTNRVSDNSRAVEGFIDTNTISADGAEANPSPVYAVYDSDFASPSTGEFDYNNVLPMVFPANVEKTIITAKYNWSDTSGLEEMQYVDIVIDWANSTVMGTSITNYENFEDHFLPKQTIQSASTDYAFTPLAGTAHNISLKIIIQGSTKTISGFPWPYNVGYEMRSGQIKIENHIRG